MKTESGYMFKVRQIFLKNKHFKQIYIVYHETGKMPAQNCLMLKETSGFMENESKLKYFISYKLSFSKLHIISSTFLFYNFMFLQSCVKYTQT